MFEIELNNETKYVPEWIVTKSLERDRRYAVYAEGVNPTIARETEKAILLEWDTESGKVSMWCPKSVLKTEEQIKAEEQADIERSNKKYDGYTKLISAAEEAGVKYVRGYLKVNTIVKECKAAGKFDAIKDLVKLGKGGRYVLND